MNRPERFGFMLTEHEKEVVCRLAEADGVPVAVVVRRLIRAEAKGRGLWPLVQESAGGAGQDQAVRGLIADDACGLPDARFPSVLREKLEHLAAVAGRSQAVVLQVLIAQAQPCEVP